ncbi:MAG: right-handed parallel beta-helix repeat-containing protein [Bryobacteraceae bacterium]
MLTTIRKVALTGVLAALAGGQAWAVTPITFCPFTISSPGNYVVTADLTCNGDGIDINASNVSVNLNGHIIKSAVGAAPGADGIFVSAVPAGLRLDHVGISGPGLILGFGGGVNINNSDYVQVTQTTVAGTTKFAGFFASGVTYLTVAGNVVAGTIIGGGLTLNQSTGAQVIGNQVVGNPMGISLLSGDSNVLTGNVVSGNTGSGIVLGNTGNLVPLTNSRVSSNTTNGNGMSGIQVVALQPGSSGNEIFSNTSSVGNLAFDLEDDNPPSCGTDFWSGNVHFTKNAACVN